MAVINGTTGANRLNGTTGRDTIQGFDGRDTLNGGRGSDHLHGGAGADVLIWDQDALSRGSVDTYIGGSAGENYDSNIYGDLAGGDRLHLNGAGGFRVTFNNSENGFALDAWGNRLNFSGIERLQTGAGNDSIDGSRAGLNAERGSGASYMPVHGLTVNSGAGNDTIRGTNGSDVIDPGTGNDRVFGGGGNDLLMPSQGNDYGHAGAGEDNVRWGNNGSMGPIYNIGHDTLVGGAGHDLLNLWAKGNGENSVGVNVVFTSASTGRASYPQANGTVVFSEFEQFWTHEGRDTVTAANATIGANRQGIMINTRWGDDRITGSAGNDTIEGGDGADTINGGRGNDFISMFEDITAANGAGVPRDAARDVLVLQDGFGSDTIRAFQVGGANGDVLNVSALHDAAGNRIDVGDVRVSSQGSSAVLSFPNGERLVLEGVNAGTLTRAMLVKLGIPAAGSAQASETASAATLSAEDGAQAKTVSAASSLTATETAGDQLAADHFAWRFAPAATVAEEHAAGTRADLSELVDSYRGLAHADSGDHAGVQHLLAQLFDWG
ncbi:calcium-binding protein [Paracoccus sp. DMF]|uniref:calcium-binding protein n=1 Tax=Paracoccus sp. DMF TaxID=400837 RepID=UPI0021E479E4|nr:calcium-binding protein [Paracoccus sp. DMF]MCV2446828.1 calcium-binding protein [Paracoccus sp. DMF]